MEQQNEHVTVHKVGFISPPAWFDISPTEFLRIAPQGTVTLQTIMRPPDFGYSKEDFLNSVIEMQNCYDSLATAGADVIVQFGYPFSLFQGWEGAQRVQQGIEQRSNARFVMMGVEVVHALQQLSCHSIAIASTYYSDSMSHTLNDYLQEAGFRVLKSENWQTQGKAKEKSSGMFIGEGELDPMDWKTPVDAVRDAIRSVARNVPDADGILITGGGIRILDIVEDLEEETGKPIIGGDISLYWGILRRLADKPAVSGYGCLLSQTG
jgi:maleate cis-trans isomerase